MLVRFIIILLLVTTSCIPLRVAPNLEEGKIVKAKKFVNNLPNQFSYVFDDPKEANEFYYYINAKYQLNYDDFNGNIPVVINGQTCYLTFYEVNKETKTVNLVPVLVDAALEDKGHAPVLKSLEVTRSGKWYLALTVTDDHLNDCLNEEHQNFEEVEKYVSNLRNEYLTTTHYIEVFLKAK
ncbi:hypothetical protein [Ulvibacter litoralis]|uniref:Lipoprotein n=1 Tax=Ulvibacter litoralis TaxID=227084 RepID=A0A1G7CWD6_9FLAO|nr:hypothetical protein [Ulvibacter litoralis]GHC46065.1 hypothetical protein GCM10008083_06290 [Ulvibacter litoralis]SDE42795.1 hypothetical protein SAMN05421855_101568 [Ulvibacter litoralis]